MKAYFRISKVMGIALLWKDTDDEEQADLGIIILCLVILIKFKPK